MKTGIRTLVLAITLFAIGSTSAIAGEGSISPVQINLKSFVKASVDFVKFSTMNADKLLYRLKEQKSTAKVCVCEIMELSNNNDEFENVAVFSEKTNNGDLSADYKMAGSLLKKERKHMQDFFFDVVKVTQKVTAATDCVSLYLRMRGDAGEVKMYDILDADVQRAK